jgi:ribonucleotide monophosphatase NagD (HAD superfamily)
MLEVSSEPLAQAHDLVMFDLDGVVYVGGTAIDGVAERIDRLRGGGVHVAFVTNNASRTPEQVADRMVTAGVHAEAGEVVTSAQAAARLLAEQHGAGARVLLLGGEGLEVALRERGLVPVTEPDGAVALASGYGPEVRWRDIMMDETVRRVGGRRPLMVGDRLDTDIEGARGVGVPSLLVLTGVTWLEELVAAAPALRPTYLSPDTRGLFEPHPVPATEGDRTLLGGWCGRVVDGRLEVEGEGSVADWWRVAASAAWAHLDAVGTPADVSATRVPGPRRGGGAE